MQADRPAIDTAPRHMLIRPRQDQPTAIENGGI
jgi:hypothetical protein